MKSILARLLLVVERKKYTEKAEFDRKLFPGVSESKSAKKCNLIKCPSNVPKVIDKYLADHIE